MAFLGHPIFPCVGEQKRRGDPQPMTPMAMTLTTKTYYV